MLDSRHIYINSENHLEIGGCDAVSLAKEYGTPLYVYDEETIRENCRMYVDSVNKSMAVTEEFFTQARQCHVWLYTGL